jgi:hypothetical protein
MRYCILLPEINNRLSEAGQTCSTIDNELVCKTKVCSADVSACESKTLQVPIIPGDKSSTSIHIPFKYSVPRDQRQTGIDISRTARCISKQYIQAPPGWY